MEGRNANRQGKALLLWFDVASSPQDRELKVASARFFRISYSTQLAQALQDVAAVQPGAICFEFDRVDAPSLQTMFEVLREFPRIPVLICYWNPEDGMESALHIFFDATAADHLSVEWIHSLCAGLVAMFEKIALKHA
jgi:hypothetical protein